VPSINWRNPLISFALAARLSMIAAISLVLGGCSGEPSAADMLQAIRKNENLREQMRRIHRNTLIRQYGGGGAISETDRKAMNEAVEQRVAEMMESMFVEKIGCVPARSGAEGFMCDVRSGLRSPGEDLSRLQPRKRRFYKTSDGWAVDAQR